MARAVLFDLDGTVWDSWPWYAGVLSDRGTGSVKSQLAELKGGMAAAVLLKRSGVKARDIRLACGTTPPPLYPGLNRALALLREKDVRLGAVTNLPKWLYGPMVETHEDALGFETIIGWSDAPRKPKPDPLELALRHLDLTPGPEHWYVGDSASDAKATVAAGISFAWASWGYDDDRPPESSRSLNRAKQVGELV